MKRRLRFTFCFVALAAILPGADSTALRLRHVPSGAVVQPAPRAQSARRRPNIVLIFPDNLGWGEVGVYGSVRGAPTPRIDRLATEGLRLTNFNVEFSCTVSRAALLTGRYAVRTGAVQNSGITQWEVTIAEALKSAGYATALDGSSRNKISRRRPTVNGKRSFRISMSSFAPKARLTLLRSVGTARRAITTRWLQSRGRRIPGGWRLIACDLDIAARFITSNRRRRISFSRNIRRANTPSLATRWTSRSLRSSI